MMSGKFLSSIFSKNIFKVSKQHRHKCTACGKTRLDKYMCADTISLTHKGNQKIKWQCGDCEEETRGRYLKNPVSIDLNKLIRDTNNASKGKIFDPYFNK
jgi:ribosomal protein L37AE/L43A